MCFERCLFLAFNSLVNIVLLLDMHEVANRSSVSVHRGENKSLSE